MKVFRKNREREFADLLTNVMGLNEARRILSYSLLTTFHHNLIPSFRVSRNKIRKVYNGKN